MTASAHGIVGLLIRSLTTVFFIILTANHAGAVPVLLDTELVFDGIISEDFVMDPRLAEDGSGAYVVFQIQPDTEFGPGQGSVSQQRIDFSGAPEGPMRILGDQTRPADGGPDASGDFVVYRVDAGDALRLQDVSTGFDGLVSEATFGSIDSARIAEDVIVWEQNGVILFQRVSLLGTATPPVVIRGPVPESGSPDVDTRFIVWEEQVAGLDSEVRAQELGGSSFFVTPDDLDDGFDEIDPATWRSLIAFGRVDSATGLADIVLRDFLNGTTEVFALGLRGLEAIALTQNFLSFNAFDVNGISQAFLLDIFDGGLLQLTSGANGAGSTDVFENFVTYTQGQQLFVSRFERGVTSVSGPGTLVLVCMGLAGMLLLRRRGRTGRSSADLATGARAA